MKRVAPVMSKITGTRLAQPCKPNTAWPMFQVKSKTCNLPFAVPTLGAHFGQLFVTPGDVFPVHEYELEVPMKSSAFSSCADAEQWARDLTWTADAVDSAEVLFQVPPDHFRGSQTFAGPWPGAEKIPLRCFQPKQVDGLFALGGCADVSREAAAAFGAEWAAYARATGAGTWCLGALRRSERRTEKRRSFSRALISALLRRPRGARLRLAAGPARMSHWKRHAATTQRPGMCRRRPVAVSAQGRYGCDRSSASWGPAKGCGGD